MTTKITVDAHAGWPVKVTVIDKAAGEGPGSHEATHEVAPHTQQDFYVHQGRTLLIEELPHAVKPE